MNRVQAAIEDARLGAPKLMLLRELVVPYEVYRWWLRKLSRTIAVEDVRLGDRILMEWPNASYFTGGVQWTQRGPGMPMTLGGPNGPCWQLGLGGQAHGVWLTVPEQGRVRVHRRRPKA